MKLKYVIIDEGYPVLFGECNKHSDFSRVGRITSAGFCLVREEDDTSPHAVALRKLTVTAFGESHSLKIKSAPHDASIIERLFTV